MPYEPSYLLPAAWATWTPAMASSMAVQLAGLTFSPSTSARKMSGTNLWKASKDVRRSSHSNRGPTYISCEADVVTLCSMPDAMVSWQLSWHPARNMSDSLCLRFCTESRCHFESCFQFLLLIKTKELGIKRRRTRF